MEYRFKNVSNWLQSAAGHFCTIPTILRIANWSCCTLVNPIPHCPCCFRANYSYDEQHTAFDSSPSSEQHGTGKGSKNALVLNFITKRILLNLNDILKFSSIYFFKSFQYLKIYLNISYNLFYKEKFNISLCVSYPNPFSFARPSFTHELYIWDQLLMLY